MNDAFHCTRNYNKLIGISRYLFQKCVHCLFRLQKETLIKNSLDLDIRDGAQSGKVVRLVVT